MVARVLRLAVVLSLVGAIAAPIALPAGAREQRRQTLTALDAGVLGKLNAIRSAHGLAPLHSSAALTAAAAYHSHELASGGYFAHTSADGSAFWKRIERWYAPQQRGGSWAVGENLLWSTPRVDASQALVAWMKSPEHRANILSPDWHEIGIAAVHVTNGSGVYGGRPVTIITTDFGARS